MSSLSDKNAELVRAIGQATEAAHAERDMHWKRKVENLETALQTARKDALEEAAKEVKAMNVDLQLGLGDATRVIARIRALIADQKTGGEG